MDLLSSYCRAEELIAAGELRPAADLCKEMLDINPDFPYGYHLMSSLFRATGTYERALAFARIASGMAPEIAAFHIQQGQVLMSLREWEAAADCFAVASKLEPANVTTLLQWGSTFAERGFYDEAMQLFTRARTVHDNAEVDEYEGLCHAMQGDTERAEHLFSRLIERRPDYANGYIHMGKLLMDANQPAQAEAFMARALRIAPRSYEALYALAVLNHWQDHADIAIAYTMQAIQARPIAWECHMLLGNLLLQQKHYSEAQQVLQQALLLRPKDAFALQLLMQAFCALDNTPEAISCIEKQLVTDPENLVLAYCKDMCLGHQRQAIPAEFISGFFNGYAEQFDYHSRHVLLYTLPSQLAAILSRLPERPDHMDLLDLGCGTGLAGGALCDVTSFRVGVDLSEKMLERAFRKKIYAELYEADAVEFMASCPRQFSLLVALDMLPYLGSLERFFAGARNVLTPSGLMAVSVETDETLGDYCLHVSGRYTHAPRYIMTCAHEEGYVIVKKERVALRVENNIPVQGELIILKKATTH